MELLDVTFLRHGRSAADDEGKLEGRYDSPITDIGRGQALARAEGWRQAGTSFDRIICSTLQRARSTAEIIANCLQVSLETDPDWMEVDNGLLAGLPIGEAEQRFPRPSFRGPYQAIGVSGESEIRLHARAAYAIEKLVLRGPGRYLVVAHGGILNAALRAITGAPQPLNGSGIWFYFGDLGYARFTYKAGIHQWIMQELVYS